LSDPDHEQIETCWSTDTTLESTPTVLKRDDVFIQREVKAMAVEDADRRDANRILSTALDDPETLSGRDIKRALELLGSDAKRVRVGAAWTFGVVAADAPARVLPHVSDIAALLDDPDLRSAATRALAYVAHANPDAVERQLRTVDESLARQCRQALWGQFSPKTVVDTTDEPDSGGQAMGRSGGDKWGWMGGGSGKRYDTESATERRRPPSERPIDPPTVDHEYDRYTPVNVDHPGETIQVFKIVYQGSENDINPGLFKRLEVPDETFRAAFDRRIGTWQAIDDHDAILPVIDWGTEPEPWLVTAHEAVTGVAKLGRGGRIDAAVWTLGEIADALRFAHDRGVIHGALTPGSIVRSSIFTEPNAWRYPRVTDWGFASLIQEGTIPDSIRDRYLAPEHRDPAAFGTIDGTTDVHGFGVLAHEALLGRPPFTDDGDRQLSAEIDRRFPELDSFLRRCLAERKTERFETVASMAIAFREATEELDG
jgi:hypothetical protein